MTRDTSIEAYNKIAENKLLKGLKLKVYNYLYWNGPCSSREVCAALSEGKLNIGGTYSGRLSEMRDTGVLSEVGFKVDDDTHHTVILWDVTSKLPIKIPKKLSKFDALLLEIRKIADQMKEQGPLFQKEAIFALEKLQEKGDPF